MPALPTMPTVAIVPADPDMPALVLGMVPTAPPVVFVMSPVVVFGCRVACAPAAPIGMGDALYEWSANLDGTEALEGREGAR